jgi:dTMP kinase
MRAGSEGSCVFITFEGPEGSGKSANARWLAARYESLGQQVRLIREPGGTPFGEAARPLLLQQDPPPSALAALLIFNAARAELVHRVIRPALAEGYIVVCDRFVDSTVAYQGYGAELPLSLVREVNQIATGGLVPDLTLLLDLPAEEGLRRKRAAGEWNVMDGLDVEFHRRVRQGYLALAAADPGRWRVIDATAPLPTVREAIARCLDEDVLQLSQRWT